MRNPPRRLHISARWRWLIASLLVIIVLGTAASFLLDEPLRRTVERQMNDRLKGYTARIERLRFHPIGLSIDLEGVVVAQDAHPDPPVMRIPRLHASVQWRELTRARVVGDFRLDSPAVYYNRQQLAQEAEDHMSPQQRGWQQALQAVYPVKINLFRINDGAVTYIDAAQARPLHLSRVNVRAQNIRNIRSSEHDYPSEIHLSARVFDAGELVLDGNADFLAEPYIGVKANFALSGLDFGYFQPILERHHLRVRRGVMAANGTIEVAPGTTVVDIGELTVDGADVDYVRTPGMAATERQAARKAHDATEEVSNEPGMLLRAASVRVDRSTFGVVNAGQDQPYRVFVADTNLTMKNLSNQLSEGTAVATLKGMFMGNGPTVLTANFRPEAKGPDFDIDLRIENTDMRAMNDLVRAYTKLDVTQGVFSLYTELAVQGGTVSGYVKPLFRDLQVNARESKEGASLGKKLKEKAVNLASKILQNQPRSEVATVVPIKGPIDDPEANTFQVVVKLIQNAFFKAILPGFEKAADAKS